jgi:anti-sigma regulatory factor (Ser/Thr protein kinase)
VFAANEIATNSLLHGGGQGTARVWREDGVVVVEVTDGGHIDHPLVGRQRPDTLTDHGRGMWLVNQLCDLVQIASTPSGTAVRVRVSCS